MILLWFIHSLQAEQLGENEPSARLVVSEVQDISVVISSKIEQEIAERLDISQQDVSVEYLGLGNARKCSNADYISIRIPEAEDFRGTVTVFAEANKAGEICAQWTLRTKIAIWQEVEVASTYIGVGEVIQTEKVRKRREQVRGIVAMNTENQVATVPLRKGAVILASQIQRKPDLKQGDSVVIRYQKGNLQVQMTGRLMMNGFIGEEVKVSSQTSNSVLNGKLVEKGIVEIRE